MRTAHIFPQNKYQGLRRFIEAQAHGTHGTPYKDVVREMQRGEKTTCWIWYILPQLESLGRSPIAKYFGIKDLEEACDYLCHPVLGQRYLEMLKQIKNLLPRPLDQIMGSPIDSEKFVNSITLFQQAAEHLLNEPEWGFDNTVANTLTDTVITCNELFNLLAVQGYKESQRTLSALLQQPSNDHVPSQNERFHRQIEQPIPASVTIKTPLLAPARETSSGLHQNRPVSYKKPSTCKDKFLSCLFGKPKERDSTEGEDIELTTRRESTASKWCC